MADFAASVENQPDNLDELLDSALVDFQNLNLTSSLQRNDGDGNGASATTSCAVQGLGCGLPDLKTKKKGKRNMSMDAQASEALNKLKEHTREAVRGLESVSETHANDFEGEKVEDWVKQFEELAGSQNMESIVETLMQHLLSKEILHEPMKEIGQRYPKWLKKHAGGLGKEDLERFSRQYKLINDLNEVYEREPENFTKIVELMQKMQECGQPPSDIVDQLAPDFSLSSLAQLSPEMAESKECCIM